MAAAAAASAKGSKELNAGNAFHASVAEPFRNRAVYIGDTIASDASGAVIQLVAVHLRAGYRCMVAAVATDEQRTHAKLKRLGVGPYIQDQLTFLQCLILSSEGIEEAFARFTQNTVKPCAVFFVDLGELALVHGGALSWWREASYAALDSSNSQLVLAVAVAHEDAQDDNTDSDMAFAAEASSCASDSLVLRPLNSGYSKEVSGHAIAHRQHGFSVDGSSSLYKMTESGIVPLS